jgi:curved DNA-binding protein CbpA
MVKKIEDLNYYELLEVDPRASTQEVYRAYDRIKKVYEPNSVALYSLFSPEETATLRQRIEEAYRILINDPKRKEYDRALRERHELPEPEPEAQSMPTYQPPPVQQRPVVVRKPAEREPFFGNETRPQPAPPPQQAEVPVPEQPRPAPLTITEFTGTAIRAVRENAGLSIRDVAGITKISERYLGYIEKEEFKKLPARAYLKGFLPQFAKALGLDPERMTGDYLRRYDTAMEHSEG